jgi:RHS repeat-associated protein
LSALSRAGAMRAIARALLFTLAGTPLLGSYSGTLATAQTVQNSTTTFEYDAVGNRTRITDPLGHVTDLLYDPLNRLKQQLAPAPTVGAARPASTFSYDGRDQVVTVLDPRNVSTSYSVDGIGNRSALTSRDTGASATTYDAAGNVKTRTDARGKVSSHSYDALGRLTRVDYPVAASSVFEYDGAGTGATNAQGLLTRLSDESGNTTYAYDGFGRLAAKTQTVQVGAASVSLTLAHAYGASGAAAGKPVSLTYPSGNRVNYLYDAAGRLNGLTLNPVNASGTGTDSGTTVNLLLEVSYAPFGPVQSWNWGNGTPSTPNGYARRFDQDGRVASFTLGDPASGGMLRTLEYDAAGRIKSYAHSGAGAPDPAPWAQTFAYDDLDRLTGWQASGTSQAFGYDANGNRTTARFGAASYGATIEAGSNRLMSTSGPAPAKSNSYDAAGNLLGDGTITYAYGARNRISSIKVGALTINQLYNGLGQRVYRGNGAGLFVYDEQGRLVGEYDEASGKATRETVYLDGLPVALLTRTVTGVAPDEVVAIGVHFVHPDHLGTPRLITRASDNKTVWRWDGGDAFGLLPPNDNPDGAGSFTFNLRMPGQYYDRDTNLFYNYFRDYDPQTGRYIQSDPIGLAGGINTYAYVGGNPVSSADPSGLCPWCVAAYIFLAENSAAVGTAAVVGAEIATGTPTPLSTAGFGGRVAGEAVHDVYAGYRAGKPVYAGITNDLARRTCEHGARFDAFEKVTSSPVTRDQARAIEQALMNKNPQFENIKNSIAPSRSWYQEAMQWADGWLVNKGRIN